MSVRALEDLPLFSAAIPKAIHANSVAAFSDQVKAGRVGHFRKAIFDLFASGQTLTDRQIMEALHEPDVNNIRPEITRLKQDGLIAEVGKVTCDRTGKKVRQSVWTGLPYFQRGR